MVTHTIPAIDGYLLGEQLSSGDLSDVYVALRECDSAKVVVKVSRAEADDRMKQRLIRECELLREVEHPNMPRLLDHGLIEGRPFLVLEHFDGQTLRERLGSGRGMAWQEASWIIEQVASAISTLHGLRILHRDIKPDNVLIDRNQRVKLIDLSIGTELSAVGELTRHGEFLGTVDYMAPEQRHRLQIDERADQYSLAAMTFEMLTGQCSLGQFRAPSELNPRIPKTFDAVILKGLERDPDDRYGSIDEYVEALLEAGTTSSHKRSWAAAIGCLCFILVTLSINALNSAGSKSPASSDSLPTPHFAAVSNDQTRPVRLVELPTFTNSIGMEFVEIPAGRFRMGSDVVEALPIHLTRHRRGTVDTGVPSRPIQIDQEFWMARCEVTVAAFQCFVEETGYVTTGEKATQERGRGRFEPLWHDPARYESHPEKPVCGVSWIDANAFCQWLSNREGRVYRLPTEAEWEYACRAGTSSPWFCNESELPDYAVMNRSWDAGPQRVAQRLPNPWGLFDMHGNMHEWCQDPFSSGIDSEPNELGPLRVLRSGGYKAPPRGLRSHMRRGHDPSVAHDDMGHAIGFRVVSERTPDRLADRRSR